MTLVSGRLRWQHRRALRKALHTEAGLRRDHPSYSVAAARSEMEAGEAMDHLPDPLYERKKGGATD